MGGSWVPSSWQHQACRHPQQHRQHQRLQQGLGWEPLHHSSTHRADKAAPTGNEEEPYGFHRHPAKKRGKLSLKTERVGTNLAVAILQLERLKEAQNTHFTPCWSHSSFWPKQGTPHQQQLYAAGEAGRNSVAPQGCVFLTCKDCSEAVRHAHRHAHTRTPTHPTSGTVSALARPMGKGTVSCMQEFQAKELLAAGKDLHTEAQPSSKGSTNFLCCLFSHNTKTC